MYERRDVFIDGDWQRPAGTGLLEVVNPATEEVFGVVAAAGADDVDRAVRSADRALRAGPWPRMTVEERCEIVMRIKDGLVARTEEIAFLAASTLGQLHRDATGLGNAAGLLDMYVESLRALKLEYLRTDASGTSLISRKPVGVVAAITPWNTPLRSEIKKAIPALLAGCTVVVKSSERTPFAGAIFAEVAAAVGLPPGVLNLVLGGPETGAALVEHPLVRKVTFTGSSATGAKIGEHCGRTFKRMQLELGGKSPAVILEDADLDAALPALDSGNYFGTGQMCVALSRVLAPRSRYDEVVDAMTERARQYRLGDPFDQSTTMGPLVAERQRRRVLDYIDIARKEGAGVTTGGGRPDGFDRGFYVEPTVLRGVANTMRIAQEEIFGPVASVIAYDSEEEAVAIANSSPYGLHGAVFAGTPERALAFARQLDTGSVGINRFGINVSAPFGGVKNSGVGREHGPEGYDSYLEYVPYTLPPELADELLPVLPQG
jgi:betaine-aldehyde dehydrogenase